jgi:hypothetical protein
METPMSFSSTMPAPLPDAPWASDDAKLPSEWNSAPPAEQQQMQQQPQYYYEPIQPEHKSTFFESISKQVLFIIFAAFLIGLFFGRSMNSPIIIHKTM